MRAQKERLEKIAKDAEKLKIDLEKGLEKREALDRIAKLRDEIAAERLTMWPVSKAIGNVKNEGPELAERIDAH